MGMSYVTYPMSHLIMRVIYIKDVAKAESWSSKFIIHGTDLHKKPYIYLFVNKNYANCRCTFNKDAFISGHMNLTEICPSVHAQQKNSYDQFNN